MERSQRDVLTGCSLSAWLGWTWTPKRLNSNKMAAKSLAYHWYIDLLCLSVKARVGHRGTWWSSPMKLISHLTACSVWGQLVMICSEIERNIKPGGCWSVGSLKLKLKIRCFVFPFRGSCDNPCACRHRASKENTSTARYNHGER